MNGKFIECSQCGGKGVVQRAGTFDVYPDECGDCGGTGMNWLYDSGAIAKYYSGPFIGRLAKEVE